MPCTRMYIHISNSEDRDIACCCVFLKTETAKSSLNAPPVAARVWPVVADGRIAWILVSPSARIDHDK